jgi:hypothetical protein
MIRLAQHTDIPYLVDAMLALKARTGWAEIVVHGYNRSTLTPFVSDKLLDPSSVVYVSDDEQGVVAFCGATLGSFQFPPYPLCLYEWGWGGEKREAVRCWQAVKEWGKKHDAEVVYRVLAKPGKHQKRSYELTTWEVL